MYSDDGPAEFLDAQARHAAAGTEPWRDPPAVSRTLTIAAEAAEVLAPCRLRAEDLAAAEELAADLLAAADELDRLEK